MISREKNYRSNSLARELRRLGGSTIEENDGFNAFNFHWFHKNTILIYDNVSAHGHDCVFIGCTDKQYIVIVHHYKFGQFDDTQRQEFNCVAGFSLLVQLVKAGLLSSRFTPIVDSNYIKALQA